MGPRPYFPAPLPTLGEGRCYRTSPPLPELGEGAGGRGPSPPRQRLVNRLGRLRPLSGVLLQQPQHQRFQTRGQPRLVPGGGHWRGVQVLANDSDGLIADKRGAAAQHLVEHGAQRVEIGARGDIPTHGLLRGHVQGRPHHQAGLREPGAVGGDRQPEVPDLRHAICRQPHVPGLEVTVHQVPLVGELQPLTHLICDTQRLFEWQPMPLGLLQQPFDVAAAHQLSHHVWLAVVLAEIEHRDDVRMGPQSSHGLRLPAHPLPPHLVEPGSLDEGERHVPVQQAVVGEIDPLLSALAEKSLHLIAAIAKGSGGYSRRRWRGSRRLARSRRFARGGLGGAGSLQRALRSGQERARVRIVWIERQNVLRAITRQDPVRLVDGRLGLIEKPVDLPLQSFAVHPATPTSPPRPRRSSGSEQAQSSTNRRGGQCSGRRSRIPAILVRC